MTAHPTRPQKSTNVRPWPLQVVAAGIRAVGAIDPDTAAKLLVRAFCTPMKKLPAGQWPAGLAPEQSWVGVEGEQIALYRWGPALNGKKVVLSHGWNGRASQLRALVEPLRAQGYAVYAFDQTAHGHSSGTTTNLPRFARTLGAVVEHLGGSVHAVVAHSLGAPAAAFAIRQGLKVERLVMVAPPGHPRRFITGFWRSFKISDALGERMIRRIEAVEGARLRDIDVAQVAAQLTLPTFVVHDRTDKEVPFLEGEEWSWALKNARLLATEGLGHNRLLAAPFVVDAIAGFIAGDGLAIDGRSSRTDDPLARPRGVASLG
jgi:pimeloyl-ACP methyl ester carboxylesterase